MLCASQMNGLESAEHKQDVQANENQEKEKNKNEKEKKITYNNSPSQPSYENRTPDRLLRKPDLKPSKDLHSATCAGKSFHI